jgi:hypothetical protein
LTLQEVHLFILLPPLFFNFLETNKKEEDSAKKNEIEPLAEVEASRTVHESEEAGRREE